MRKMVTAILLSAACVRLCAQTATMLESAAPAPNVNGLTYQEAERFWADLPTPYVYGPLGCASDGAVFVYSVLDANLVPVHRRSAPVSYTQASTPPMVTQNTPMQLEVIEPTGQLRVFDVTHIGDLRSIIPSRSYDVGENEVDFLMSAIPGKIGEDTPGTRGNFVARFNREGQYVGATSVHLPGLKPLKIAAFPNGDLLIFAADEVNLVPRLLRYPQHAEAAMAYEPDTAFATSNAVIPPSLPKYPPPTTEQIAAAQLDAAVLNTQMVHRRDAILVLQMNAGSPLYEAFADGSIRSIDLPKVAGFTADSLIPSDELLYVRYRKIRAVSVEGDAGLILEINPTSGEEMRRIPTGSFSVWSVACVRERTLRAVRWKGQHNVQFLSAPLH